jgi:8-oxo-dGTP pyrophosphatase MutT (NUDIX family)/CYTH domain-containing protein
MSWFSPINSAVKDASAMERRFLLNKPVDGTSGGGSKTLQIGCLSAQGNREVFVCRAGAEHFLRVCEGRQRFHRKCEVPLEKSHFESLWKLVEGARIYKKIRPARLGSLEFLVETIECRQATFSIAVVRFPSRRLATAFQPPECFGQEISGHDEFSDAHLALHGIPPLRNGCSQAGALPFLFKDGILHIVLITSSSGTRWIIPKGGLEHNMSRQEVALMEAAEEAGAIGSIEHGLKTECRQGDQRLLHLYPLRVAVLLPNWPERLQRRRVVLPIYRALLRIRDAGLAQAIRRLARQIEP